MPAVKGTDAERLNYVKESKQQQRCDSQRLTVTANRGHHKRQPYANHLVYYDTAGVVSPKRL